jgi:chromosome partitioning protein
VGRVIAIANQKGGVGKTTTAVNVAASLAVAEQHTLLVDGDPQGNATSGIGLTRERFDRTVYDAIIGALPLEQVIVRSVQFAQLDVAPATPDLAGAEVELVDHPRRQHAMRDALEPVRARYDYVLIDCPPSLGLLTLNMLAAADSVLIPVQCEYYALEGLTQLLNTIHLIQRGVNEGLHIDGVLLTMYDARLNLSRQVAADAREYFGSRVFQTVVPRNVRLAEAPSFGKPIILYDVASVGAQAYVSIARELMDRYALRDGAHDRIGEVALGEVALDGVALDAAHRVTRDTPDDVVPDAAREVEGTGASTLVSSNAADMPTDAARAQA